MTAPRAAAVPTAGASLRALAGVTLLRLRRSKTPWIAALLGALPLAVASAMHGRASASARDMFEIVSAFLAIIPAMLVGASIGEELETRTSTYLWSRPIARWVVPVAKLCALAPVAIGVLVVSWFATATLAVGVPSARSCLGIGAGALACSLIAGAIATLAPRYAMALTIAYLLTDFAVGLLPFAIANLSVTYHVRALAGVSGDAMAVAPVLGLTMIAALWAVIAGLKLRRLEV